MFTGLVEAIGSVIDLCALDHSASGGGGTSLTIGNAESILTDASLGDSIAINGTCLTVTEMTKSSFKVGISPETLSKTCLGDLIVGSQVNLERSILPTTRLGGHIVQGHVDCTIEIIEKSSQENSLLYTFRVPTIADDLDLLSLIVQKGYVCLDGISLTVTQVNYKARTFSIMMIAYTQEKVTLTGKNVGDRVNLEVDATFKHLQGMFMNMLTGSNTFKDYLKQVIKDVL